MEHVNVLQPMPRTWFRMALFRAITAKSSSDRLLISGGVDWWQQGRVVEKVVP
jgi:hypothetical protein